MTGIGIRVMRRVILALLGIGIVQASGAAETTFQPSNILSRTINNTPVSSKSIYKTNSGTHIFTNEEISKAIDNISAHTKTRKYQQSSPAASDSLDDMKRWADQGNAEYQVKIGWIYYDGKGVRQDLVLARKMFQKAAKQGHIQGQGVLGAFYEHGLGGLRQNRATAKEWYGKTCDAGFQHGCDEYRRLNERGY